MGNCAAAVSRPDPAADKYAAHIHGNSSHHRAANDESDCNPGHNLINPDFNIEYRDRISSRISNPELGNPH